MSAGTAGPAASTSADAPRSGLAVLAVDDEPRALADVERLLAGSPWVGSVDTAGGGREALVKLGVGAYVALVTPRQFAVKRAVALARRGGQERRNPHVHLHIRL